MRAFRGLLGLATTVVGLPLAWIVVFDHILPKRVDALFGIILVVAFIGSILVVCSFFDWLEGRAIERELKEAFRTPRYLEE